MAEEIAQTYNVLPMDAGAFRALARLMHRRPDDLIENARIAATAVVHNLTVGDPQRPRLRPPRRENAEPLCSPQGLRLGTIWIMRTGEYVPSFVTCWVL